MAITWRTLNQPTLAGVGLLMNGAQQGLNQGFNALQNVLDQRNKTENANFQVQKANNTADYLDAVQQGITDPSQANDPAVQANLAALKQQFGYQVDANAIRGADEKRVAALQQQGLNRIEFDDKSRVDTERDTVDKIAGLYQAGDYAGGDALRQGQNFRDDAKLDELKVNAQRGYSGEARAVQDQGWQAENQVRAAQSHALNQQATKASLDFTNLQRKDLLDGKSRERAGDQLIGSALASFDGQRTADAAKTNNIVEDYGFKVVDGVPDLTGASDEVKANLAKDLQEAGVGMTSSPTAMRKKLEADLRANHYPEKEITAQLANFEAGVNRNNTLSAIDQADVDTQKASVTTAVKQATEDETKAFNKLTKSNIFLQGVEAPNLTTEDVSNGIKGNEFDPAFFEGWNRDQILESTSNIMTKGIEVDGVRYEVPPPMLKAAMAMGANDWFDPRQGIEDSLAAFIRANPEAYAASIVALDAHKKELRSINEAGIKQSSRIDTQSRAKNNIPYDTNKFLKTLLKERN